MLHSFLLQPLADVFEVLQSKKLDRIITDIAG